MPGVQWGEVWTAVGLMWWCAVAQAASAVPVASAAQAAQQVANQHPACQAIRPFYWELGDGQQRLAGGAVADDRGRTPYQADTVLPIASSTKWLYAAWVVQQRGGVLNAADVRALTMRAGYTSFGLCRRRHTVAECASFRDHADFDPQAVDHFHYAGGHFQQHGLGMGLGPLDAAGLAQALGRVLGPELGIGFSQVMLAGGAEMAPQGYAAFLRKLLRGELLLGRQLGQHATCTSERTRERDCPGAPLHSPIPELGAWHYSLGHWVEDDPASSDGAFSSGGAFGFYPWISADQQTYGLIARKELRGAPASARCGLAIRRAWASGTAG